MKIKEHYFWFLSIFIIFFSFSIISNKFISNSQEEQLHQVLSTDNSIKKALFTTKHNISQIMINLIKNEKKSIKAAIFLITDKQIANALVEAKKRGIDIDIITCHSNLNTIITYLVENGINIHIFGAASTKKGLTCNPIMHNKFLIFEQNINDKSILWTGSFNLTCKAQSKNKENVLILEDKCLISQYLDEYEGIETQTKALVRASEKKELQKNPKVKMSLTERFKRTFRILTN